MPITLLVIVATALLCLAGASVVILHPRIHEGLLIKLGLILLSVGAIGLAAHVTHAGDHIDADDLAMLRAMALCCTGLLVILAGLAWRIWRCPAARAAARQASGWAELDELDDDGQEHHRGKVV